MERVSASTAALLLPPTSRTLTWGEDSRSIKPQTDQSSPTLPPRLRALSLRRLINRCAEQLARKAPCIELVALSHIEIEIIYRFLFSLRAVSLFVFGFVGCQPFTVLKSSVVTLKISKRIRYIAPPARHRESQQVRNRQ